MDTVGAQGKFVSPFCSQAVNLVPKSARSPKLIIGLEKPPEVPVLYRYPWDRCCISLQPIAGTHNTQERDLFYSQERLHEIKTS